MYVRVKRSDKSKRDEKEEGKKIRKKYLNYWYSVFWGKYKVMFENFCGFDVGKKFYM